MPLRIDVISDLPTRDPYYQPTLVALDDACSHEGIPARVSVVRSGDISTDPQDLPHGIVIGPGKPLESSGRTQDLIRTARERGIPLVAT